MLKRGNKAVAFSFLWSIARLFLTLDLKVDKVQAVNFLATASYPFKNEVKGLTRKLVDSILASEVTPPQTPELEAEMERLSDSKGLS